ncbi:hypothetical protein GCM10025734_08180 [Kitasatospora paranensis]
MTSLWPEPLASPAPAAPEEQADRVAIMAPAITAAAALLDMGFFLSVVPVPLRLRGRGAAVGRQIGRVVQRPGTGCRPPGEGWVKRRKEVERAVRVGAWTGARVSVGRRRRFAQVRLLALTRCGCKRGAARYPILTTTGSGV